MAEMGGDKMASDTAGGVRLAAWHEAGVSRGVAVRRGSSGLARQENLIIMLRTLLEDAVDIKCLG